MSRYKKIIYLFLVLSIAGCSSIQKQKTITKVDLVLPSMVTPTPITTLKTLTQVNSAQYSIPATPSRTTVATQIQTQEPDNPFPPPTIIPTNTHVTNTETSTPDLTLTPNPTHTPVTIEQDIPECVGKGKIVSPLNDFSISGTIVYQSGYYEGLYTIGGKPLKNYQIEPAKQIAVYGFTPDGKWLAYSPRIPASDNEIVFSTPTMILLSAEGERIEQTIDITGLDKELDERCRSCQGFEFFDSAGEWINNTLIYIHLGATGEWEGGMISHLPKVFDPFTGAWQNQWFEDLPDLYMIIPDRLGIDHIKISPDLSRVSYPAVPKSIILRDIARGSQIWSDNNFYRPWGEMIEWSPDSNMVAVTNLFTEIEDRKLLIITRDGDETEIVTPRFPLIDFIIDVIRWSPDSRYLAYIGSHPEVNLYLFDTQTNQYVYQCPLPGMTGDAPSLVWSPDSDWIAFGDQLKGPMQLLNRETGEVIKLLDDAAPVGWSEVFPVQWP